MDKAYAFLSPSTLSLLANSINSIIGLLVAIAVNIVLLFTYLKSNSKKIFFSTLIVLILVTSFFVSLRFLELRRLNTFKSPQEDVLSYKWNSFIRETGLNETEDSIHNWKYGFDYLDQSTVDDYTKRINLDEAINNDSYKVLTFNLDYKINNATKIYAVPFLTYPDNLTKLENYMEKLNLSKKDKIVFVCYSGYTSSRVSMVLNFYGYDTKYSSLMYSDGINNYYYEFEDNIDFDYKTQSSNVLNVLIDKFSPDREKENYVVLLFDRTYRNILNSKSLISSVRNNITVVSIDGVMPLPSEFMVESFNKERIISKDTSVFNDRKIICIDKIHCQFSKYFLDYYNISVEKVYLHDPVDTFDGELRIEKIPEILEILYIMNWNEN